MCTHFYNEGLWKHFCNRSILHTIHILVLIRYFNTAIPKVSNPKLCWVRDKRKRCCQGCYGARYQNAKQAFVCHVRHEPNPIVPVSKILNMMYTKNRSKKITLEGISKVPTIIAHSERSQRNIIESDTYVRQTVRVQHQWQKDVKIATSEGLVGIEIPANGLAFLQKVVLQEINECSYMETCGRSTDQRRTKSTTGA